MIPNQPLIRRRATEVAMQYALSRQLMHLACQRFYHAWTPLEYGMPAQRTHADR